MQKSEIWKCKIFKLSNFFTTVVHSLYDVWFDSFLASKKKPEIVETNVQKWILFPQSYLSPLHSLPFSPWELMADGNYI